MFRFAGFELDPQRVALRGPDGGAIKLRPKTFEMLRLFVVNAGRILGKQELMEAVWPNVHVGEDNLFQCIREIRTALGDDQRQIIKLVSGHGYMFAPEVSVEPAVRPANSNAALSTPRLHAEPTADAATTTQLANSRRTLFGPRGPAAVATLTIVCTIIGLAVAAPVFRPDLVFKRMPPTVAVVQIIDASEDPRGAATAGSVTDRLIDGLARIDNIRVIASRAENGASRLEQTSAPSAQPDFVVRGELQRGSHAWTLQMRMIKTADGEVQSIRAVTVDINETDPQREQSRLAAGAGHQLAQRLNRMLEGERASATTSNTSSGSGRIAIEQAIASINQTTRERFDTAQTILQNALVAEPDNIDIAVALAALQMRGIQMIWYSPAEASAAEAQASATLERALRAKPNSIHVLETYCRFLSATNHFVESLVTCARALSFDPWSGLALYLIGLGQLHLGRFEDALATFQQADRFDTPQVSRWTWLLGIGWAHLLMGRSDDALPWFQRSIAITPASGRPHMLMAAAYQKSGRFEEAKTAIKEGLKLRPGTTTLNIGSPMKNASPVFIEASKEIIRLMVAAGLPEG